MRGAHGRSVEMQEGAFIVTYAFTKWTWTCLKGSLRMLASIGEKWVGLGLSHGVGMLGSIVEVGGLLLALQWAVPQTTLHLIITAAKVGACCTFCYNTALYRSTANYEIATTSSDANCSFYSSALAQGSLAKQCKHHYCLTPQRSSTASYSRGCQLAYSGSLLLPAVSVKCAQSWHPSRKVRSSNVKLL